MQMDCISGIFKNSDLFQLKLFFCWKGNLMAASWPPTEVCFAEDMILAANEEK